MNELKITEATELSLIEKSKSDQIKATFDPMVKMVAELESRFEDVINKSKIEITKSVTKEAKILRLEVSKIRINTEKCRKEQKEEYLRAGKAIDGVSNILKWAITEKEETLKEIENHFEIQIQKEKEALHVSRVLELSKYISNENEVDFRDMPSDVWDAYLNSKKKDHEDILAAKKEAALKIIETEREAKEDMARITEENESLKKERDLREKSELEEKIKRGKIESELHEKLRKENEAREQSILKAKFERYKIQLELDERNRIESQKAMEAHNLIQNQLNSDDATKIDLMCDELLSISEKFAFKSDENIANHAEAITHINSAIKAMR